VNLVPSSIETERLVLVPCSLQAARASLNGVALLRAVLGWSVPDTWPPDDLRDALALYAKELARDASHLGWGVWLSLAPSERSLVGSVGFKGRPDAAACVEIGYGTEPDFRRRGFATEAAGALMSWAWRRGVRRVVAECSRDNVASIRVLESLGMERTEPRGEMLWWEIRAPS
jgi:[ribosomal protein S5]-alanine N-acetyltransferase